jgi:hypothetical protein
MPHARRIKKPVRKRDGQRCVDCGMSATEHVGRYRRTLHVHRLDCKGPVSVGPYEVETCITLCEDVIKQGTISVQQSGGGMAINAVVAVFPKNIIVHYAANFYSFIIRPTSRT